MPNDAVKAQVIEQWSVITQTKLIEDGVREERVEEESRRSFNRKMSGETCWDKLCASGIHAQKHRFTRLPFETTVVPRGEKDRSVKSLFAVKPSQVPVMYRDIVSFSSKAPYRSPAPLFEIAAEDRRLIKHCLAIGDVEMAEEWSILARNRKRAGTVAGSMVMGFPLNVQTFQGEQYYTLKPMDKIYWLPVLSPTQWEARHIAWRSPVWLRIRAGRWFKWNHLSVMHPVCEIDTLIKIAARHAFNDIPKAGIVQIGRRRLSRQPLSSWSRATWTATPSLVTAATTFPVIEYILDRDGLVVTATPHSNTNVVPRSLKGWKSDTQYES